MGRENDDMDAASPASDRILDRKIESRALPASFSSNLGRKAPVAEKGGKVKSVRAIVDWLEKTGSPGPESPESITQTLPGKPEDADKISLVSKATTTTTTIKSDFLQPSAPDPSTPTSGVFPAKTPPTHPEEYSLTLLKYKSYFNNRPLARCLDDDEGQVASPVAEPTSKAASASSCYSAENLDSIMASLNDMSREVEPGSPTPLGRARSQHGTRLGGTSTDYTTQQVGHGSTHGTSEATALDNVRARLWIRDDELHLAPIQRHTMVPTSARRTVSHFLDHRDQIPLSGSPWRPMPGAELSQVPWRWSKPPDPSPLHSPPRPPCPTRTPPPIPTVSRPDMSGTEKSPEPAIPSNVIAALMASLKSAKDINNLRQNAQPGGKVAAATAQSPETVTDQFGDLYSSPPSLRKISTDRSHHSAKHSAGHSHAFNGGRSHKASVASSGSMSRELMTTEERMSEADEFFAMDDDDDGSHLVGTLSIATSYDAAETPVRSTLDGFGHLAGHPSKKTDDWK